MNYNEAREYLDQYRSMGSVYGLSVMRELMKRLGDPQEKLSVIQVAGTNGKGSCIASLQAIFLEAGYRVGAYTSPAVFSELEVFCIDGMPISPEQYAGLIARVREACESMVCDGWQHPTVFEMETAVAYLWFYTSGCELALIETGLGGDMDATNITTRNLCSILMSISLDHMALLGDTVEEIAAHKAGIIKDNGTVIAASASPSVLQVISDEAKRKKAQLIVTEPGWCSKTSSGFTYRAADETLWDNIELALCGEFQIENALCVLECITYCISQGFSISSEQVRSGLKKTRWHGRLEQICLSPVCVIDGAHNPGAALQLRNSIKKYFTNSPIIGIIGILADKDYGRVLDIMLPLLSFVIAVTPNNARGLAASRLVEEVEKRGVVEVVEAVSLTQAWRLAKEWAQSVPDGMVLSFGSLSWLGEFKAIVEAENDNRNKDI